MPQIDYDNASAIAQIERCNFECEGGPLANNTAYRWLKEKLQSGPKFHLGQWVFLEVEAEVSGVKISNTVKLCVVGISMSSDTERLTWNYALSNDPPAPWHYGSGVQFRGVDERKLLASRLRSQGSE